MFNQNSIYKQWLNHPHFTKEEKQTIDGYTQKEISKFFKNKKFYFGTAGVRKKVGLSPQKLNIYTYRLLAQGYAEYIKKQNGSLKVIVGHDNRHNGDKFAIAIAEVLEKNGLTVFFAPNNSSIPTPLISYYIRKLGLAGGINVTASHNPPNYNGFKTYNLTGCQTNQLEEEIIIQNIPPMENIFDVQFEKEVRIQYLPNNYLEVYFDELINILPEVDFKNQEFKVLFSSHHGTSSQIMKKLAIRLGFNGFEEFEPECNITHLLNEGENTNPEEDKSFVTSKDYANKNGINYLFAHDPDSDRSAILEKQTDGEWYAFNGNEMAMLFLHFLLTFGKKKSNPYIISTFVSGNFVKKLVGNDAKIYLTKTGFKNISRLVEEYEKSGNLLIAFEEAIGALLFPINREKDGFQQSSLALKMIGKFLEEGKSCKQVLNDLYAKHGYWIGLTDYFFSDAEDWKKIFKLKMQKLHSTIPQKMFGYQIKEIFFNQFADSLEWIMENDCWIKFRLSGTEPKFKIYYNLYGSSKESVDIALKQFRDYFKKELSF